MENNRKVTLGLVVLNALCAVIWTILTIEDIIEGNETGVLVLHSFCAVIWLIVAILNYIRYRNVK